LLTLAKKPANSSFVATVGERASTNRRTESRFHARIVTEYEASVRAVIEKTVRLAKKAIELTCRSRELFGKKKGRRSMATGAIARYDHRQNSLPKSFTMGLGP